jgi:uncharacterized OB-fold protein
VVTDAKPLTAPLEVAFDYTRSLGGTLSAFMTALRQRRLVGTRGSDGRVHVPPAEYDPVTFDALTETVEVGQEGAVLTWSWVPTSHEGQPLEHPFAWALIRLDGADTPMLHAVDAGSADRMRTGMRVRVRWVDEPAGHIKDIACFDPVEKADRTPAETPPERGEPVTMITTPVRLHYTHSASPVETRYLLGLAEGRILGQKCPQCGQVYVPPRGACPTDGVPTEEEVEVAGTGTITTFCVVNVPFMGQRITPPYVAAHVLLDGADIPVQHLVLGCEADEVRMGMRVEAVWKPREQWEHSMENIDHFRPNGEPDAPYDTYAHHL